jgi:mercuric ion transport protein
MNLVRRHADKLGTGGSLFAALCCLGTPAVVTFAAAIGAGFLVNDTILLPLLAICLFAALWGLDQGRKVYRDPRPLRLGAAGRVLLAGGVLPGGWMVALGAVLLIAGTSWNVIARWRCMASVLQPAANAPRGARTPR